MTVVRFGTLARSSYFSHNLILVTDSEQMEHGPDRPDDVFPRSSGQHAGTAGPVGQVREQDPDAYQDWSQLEDACSIPARCLLHA